GLALTFIRNLVADLEEGPRRPRRRPSSIANVTPSGGHNGRTAADARQCRELSPPRSRGPLETTALKVRASRLELAREGWSASADASEGAVRGRFRSKPPRALR